MAIDPKSTASRDSSGMAEPTGRGDLVAGVLALIVAIAGSLFVVPGWVYVPERVAGTADSPAVMPLLMLALVGFLGLLLIIETLRNRRWSLARRSRKDWARAVGMIALCSTYLALIFLIGLPLATGLSLALTMTYFGERRWVLLGAVAAIVPLVLWAFFAHVALVPMPRPVLEIGFLETAPKPSLLVSLPPLQAHS